MTSSLRNSIGSEYYCTTIYWFLLTLRLHYIHDSSVYSFIKAVDTKIALPRDDYFVLRLPDPSCVERERKHICEVPTTFTYNGRSQVQRDFSGFQTHACTRNAFLLVWWRGKSKELVSLKPWPNGLARRLKSTQVCRTCEGWPNGFAKSARKSQKAVNSTRIIG